MKMYIFLELQYADGVLPGQGSPGQNQEDEEDDLEAKNLSDNG